MKTIWIFAIAGIAAFGAMRASANLEVSADISIHASSDFYQPLTPYGDWVVVGSYGRCWRPVGVETGWRPYCVGHWEWTDCGWYWVSDEPWGWACYHYGSWIEDPHYGWCWVPGVDWAPAWVVWRTGGGYCGWAPCAPAGVVVTPSLFVFVGQDRFTQRCSPRTVIVNNTTVINKTKIINVNVRRENITIDGKKRPVFYNEGPGVRTVERAANRKLVATSVRDAYRHDVQEYRNTTKAIREGTNQERERKSNRIENRQQNQIQNQIDERNRVQQQNSDLNQKRIQERNDALQKQNQIEQQQRQREQQKIQQDRNQIEQQNRSVNQQREQERQRIIDQRNRMQNPQQQEIPNRAAPPEQKNPQQVPPVRERQIPPGQLRDRQRQVAPPNQPQHPQQENQRPDDGRGRDGNRDQNGPPQ